MPPPRRPAFPARVLYRWDEIVQDYVAWEGDVTQTPGATFDVIPKSSFFDDMTLGRIPGSTVVVLTGAIVDGFDEIDVFETVWDEGGLYIFLSAATQLFVSSTSASDTTQLIAVLGIDAPGGDEVVRTGTLSGTTQVALDGNLFSVHLALQITGPELAGDVFVAQSDTSVTLPGRPDTRSNIKGRIIQGNAITRQFVYIVPKDKEFVTYDDEALINKNGDVKFQYVTRDAGSAFDIIGFETASPQGTFQATRRFPIVFATGTRIDVRVSTKTVATTFGYSFFNYSRDTT